MEKIEFYKYHGTGNDFIMIDDRSLRFNIEDIELVKSMCDRRFGIGADGLILLRNHANYDFEMVYFNADGAQSSMCGNGGRCIVAFAAYLKVISKKCAFLAIDGSHEGLVEEKYISIRMTDVYEIRRDSQSYILDTGSPHFVKFVENVDHLDVFKEGQAIRYNETYKKQGINVNFVERIDGAIKVATYERGVEDETYSCGTGVVASSIATSGPITTEVNIITKGGNLSVNYDFEHGKYTNIWLTGPTVHVYQGVWKK